MPRQGVAEIIAAATLLTLVQVPPFAAVWQQMAITEGGAERKPSG